MRIDLSKAIGEKIVDTLNHSVTSSIAHYENESDSSVTFKGLTTILKFNVGIMVNGQMRMIERKICIGANQDLIVKSFHDGLDRLPFIVKCYDTAYNIRRGSGFDSSLNIAYNKSGNDKVELSETYFSLACDKKFEITDKISDKVYNEQIKPLLCIDDIDNNPLFVCIESFVSVNEYFHSGKDNYSSICFIDKSISKAFITLDCYSCNKHTYSTISVSDWSNINNDISDFCSKWDSIDVHTAQTDHVTMCSDGFNGRYF